MSNDPAAAPAVLRLVALPTDELFEVYLALAGGDPERADVAALAIREQARAGTFGAELAELLAVCVDAAPSLLCVGHLAKALAALGRKGEPGAVPLVAQLTPSFITDDVAYWSYDGCVWAFGYLGGPDADAFIGVLEREKPTRATKSQSLYQGKMPPADRERLFQKALTAARELLAKKDAGAWTARQMTIGGADTKKPAGGIESVDVALKIPLSSSTNKVQRIEQQLSGRLARRAAYAGTAGRGSTSSARAAQAKLKDDAAGFGSCPVDVERKAVRDLFARTIDPALVRLGVPIKQNVAARSSSG